MLHLLQQLVPAAAAAQQRDLALVMNLEASGLTP